MRALEKSPLTDWQIGKNNINPWLFAKYQGQFLGEISLKNSANLADWVKDCSTICFELNGIVDEYQQKRLSGKISAELILECQRCLEPLPYPMNQSFDYVLIKNIAQENNITDDSETLICEDYLDVAWFIEEEFLLSLPMVAKHQNCSMPNFKKDTSDNLIKNQSDNPFSMLKMIVKK